MRRPNPTSLTRVFVFPQVRATPIPPCCHLSFLCVLLRHFVYIQIQSYFTRTRVLCFLIAAVRSHFGLRPPSLLGPHARASACSVSDQYGPVSVVQCPPQLNAKTKTIDTSCKNVRHLGANNCPVTARQVTCSKNDHYCER